MRDWNPFTAILFVLTANTVCSLSMVQSQMSVKWKRLILAIGVTGILQYAAFFILTGFGWGWPAPSDRALLFVRLGLGMTIGTATTIFASILSGRWRTTIALMIIALSIFIFAPDPTRFLGLELLFSALVMVGGSFLWYRK